MTHHGADIAGLPGIATSTLRIARNGWLSRQVRLALVAEGMALLVQQNT
jgi:hypothetical protein